MGDHRSTTAGATTFNVVITLLITLSLATIALVMASNRFDLFESKTIDRSGTTVLEQIREIEEFDAAEGNFIQDVDIENDTILPGFIAGERVVALVKGSVRATVDFSELDEDAIKVVDESTIQITLPEPVLSDADIDEKSVKFLTRDRGLADRVADVFAKNPTDDGPVFQKAEELMNKAAVESDLLGRGRTNTEQWLGAFLKAAGFQDVTVTWE